MLLRRYVAYLTTRAVRPAQHRPQGGVAAALLRLGGARRAARRRSDDRRAAPSAATVGCRGCSTRRELEVLLDGATPRGRRRSPAASARDDAVLEVLYGIGPAGQRAVRRSMSTPLDLERAAVDRLGQGLQAAPGAAHRRRRWPRCGRGWRSGTTWCDADGAGRDVCSPTSGASGSRRATCAGSSIAARRRRPTRTPCATASPPTCSTGAPTSASCRSCSVTPTWPPRSATPTSAGSGCGRCTPRATHAHEHRR